MSTYLNPVIFSFRGVSKSVSCKYQFVILLLIIKFLIISEVLSVEFELIEITSSATNVCLLKDQIVCADILR